MRFCRTCLFLLGFGPSFALAEVHTLTLQQALAVAARQNPDVLLARLDTEHALAAVDVARDPFTPRFAARSDAMYTYGYPNNVNGHSPSLLAGQIDMSIYDRPRRYQVAATREQVNTYEANARGKLDEVAFRIASLFLDLQAYAQSIESARADVSSFEKIAGTTASQVRSGYALPLDARRAEVDRAGARQKQEEFELDRRNIESVLATALGFSGNDRVEPPAVVPPVALPERTEVAVTDSALANNRELQSLEASALAKRIELKSYRNTRIPQVNLVAQYSLIQKSTYESYFPSRLVQRNNGEIGADFILPLLVGTAPIGRLSQAQIDLAKLQIQIFQARNRVIANTHRAFEQFEKANESLRVSREQADLASDEAALESSRASEGRAALPDVEHAANARNDRELAVEQAAIELERTKLEILHQLGLVFATLSK